MQSVYGPRARAFHAICRFLLETFVYPHFRTTFEGCVRVTVRCPSKRGTVAESFVSPCESRVDDVFAISDDRDEPAVR